MPSWFEDYMKEEKESRERERQRKLENIEKML